MNEAAKCFNMPHTLLSSLSRTLTKYKMATTFGLTYEKILHVLMAVRGVTTWKELMIGIRQLVRLLFDNDFITPELLFKSKPV